MSQDKSKHFERQRTRYKPIERRRVGREDSVNTSQISSQIKNQSVEHDISVTSSVRSPRTNANWALPKKTQDALRKLISTKKEDLPTIFKDKVLRQQVKKEEKRLTKMRTEQKLEQQGDLELSLLALNNILSVSQESIFDFSKDRQAKTPTKNVIRVNQQKQMTKQLSIIDEQIADNNISGAKLSIQNLLKRFGKDQFLQGKINHLAYIQNISDLYEKESNKINQIAKYLEKLSNIDNSTPETINQSVINLKGLKKQLVIATTKQSKKADKNEEMLKYLGQFDNLTTVLTSYLQPKVEKKGMKREVSVVKQLETKVSSSLSQQAANYCKDLLEKTSEDKQVLFKEIQMLKRNRKKAIESPYSLIIKIYDHLTYEKKEVTQFNVYLKSLGQIYFKKNLNAQTIQAQINRLEEKYPSNDVLKSLKPNIEYLISNVQEKERSGKQLQNLENQIKKLKAENERLSKTIQSQKSKIVEKSVDDQKIDKKKQMEDRRAKEMERSKNEKLEKDIEKYLDNVFVNLGEKKWKPAKNAINVFLKRFEETNHPIVPVSIRSLNAFNEILSSMENYEAEAKQIQKKELVTSKSHQKEKLQLENRIKAADQYQNILKDLLQNYSDQKYAVKKFFDDLRRDRKKIVQDRYVILNKLEEPLSLWRSRKFGGETDQKNMSLTYSQFSFASQKQKSNVQKVQSGKKSNDSELKLGQLNKDVDELLSLIKKIQNGGQWWKFIPKNMRNNATFKPVYNVLEQYRKLQLSNKVTQASTSLSKQDDKPIQSALTTVSNSILKDKAVVFEDYWSKKLSIFAGKPNCDKLANCLNELNLKHNERLKEQSDKMKAEIDRLNSAIQNLERKLSDKERSPMETSSKKSFELKSSRRSSRSREKREDKSKQFIESYIQDERNYLNKIEDLEKENKHLSEQNQSLEMRAKAVEQELQTTLAKYEQVEKIKGQLQQQRYKNFNEINNLKGQLQIAEGRITQTHSKYESDLSYFKELSEKVQSKIVEETIKSKQLEDQNKSLKESFKTEGAEQPHGNRQLNLGFKVNLDSKKHVVDFFDTDAKRTRPQRPQKNPEPEKKQQQAQPVQQHNQIDDLKRQIIELQQKLRLVLSENEKHLLVITDLTTENNELKIRLQNMLATQSNSEAYIRQIEVLKAERSNLIQELQKFNAIKNEEIQRQVKRAVQSEVQKFNAFLAQFKADQEKLYLNEIIPKKVEEALANYRAQQLPQSPQRVQIDANSVEFDELYRQRHEAERLDMQKSLEVAVQRTEQYWKEVLANKEQEWTKMRTDWQELKRIQIEGILKNQPSSDTMIEQWKEMFLPSIIEQQRKASIEYFVQNELPEIINHEYQQWLKSQQINQEQILRLEWSKWNDQKEEEISARLKQVEIHYQAQIIEWQQKLFKEQERTTEVENAIKAERSGWKQERDGWDSQRYGWDKQRKGWQQERQAWMLQKQALTSLRENPQDKQKQFELRIVQLRNQWQRQKTQQITKIIDIQIKKCQEFHKGELTRILQAERQQWEIWHQQQINIVTSNQRKVWEQEKEVDFEKRRVLILQEVDQRSQNITQEINIVLSRQRQKWQQQKEAEFERRRIQIIQQTEQKTQQFSQQWQQKQKAIRLQQEQQFNLRLNAQRAEWEKAKAQLIHNSEISTNNQRNKWQSQKRVEIQQLLTQKRMQWKQEQNQEINVLLSRQRAVWQKQKQVEIAQRLRSQDNELQIRIQNEVKQRQAQWELNILAVKERQWRQVHSKEITQITNQRLAELERQFHEVRIPQILQAEYQGWVDENQRIMTAERQNWFKQLPILLKMEQHRVYIEPLLQQCAARYEQQITILRASVSSWQQKARQIESNHTSSDATIKQLQSQLTQTRSRLEQTIRIKESIESEVTRLKVEIQQITAESHKASEQALRIRTYEQDIVELRRVIQLQKNQINNFAAVHREIDELRREIHNLTEINRQLQNSKLAQISQIKSHYESQLLELTAQRNKLISQLSEVSVHKTEVPQASYSSLERQIAILLATIKTKDADIAFLKRSIDSHKDELTEARDQYSQALKSKHELQKRMSELKSSKTEVDVELKYLKEREDTLKRKVQSLEDEVSALRNRPHETHVTESKSEVYGSFQVRFSEIESMLSLKTQQCQSLTMEVDRLRYELQRSQATIHSSNIEIQSLRARIRDNDSHYSTLKLQLQRTNDELTRTKLYLTQASSKEEELNKKIQIHIRTLKSEESDKLRVETELHRLTEQYNKLWRDFGELQRVNRREAERSAILERQVRQVRGKTSVDSAEIQMLTKINNEVSELTMANRQLTMKIVTLQNQDKIIANFKQIQKFFLLLQKHTDIIVDQLLKEGSIPNLESYHRFLSESRPYIASGDIPVYFGKWQTMMREMFENCLATRSEQMREQAEELIRLKEQMNEILEKQIEVSESDSGQLVEDYKAVLVDIKSLVREFVTSGDREYLNLLCQSLGVPLK